MKRHDVSNPGPDTRYPPHERIVVLWLDGGDWARGWFDEESGRWRRSRIVGPIDGVLAWSDPTETTVDHTAVMRQAPIGHALAMRVLQSDLYRQLDDTERAECDALIHDHIAALRGAIGGV